ncbi:MAG: epoxyqueuosine reductase [Actinomycetia bacterium]|nr:epoxyqueuosine reductase [Actinomycetes bacterium]
MKLEQSIDNRVDTNDTTDGDTAHVHFDSVWLDKIKEEIGVDLIGALAVTSGSHPDFLFGVETFLPQSNAAIVLGMEMASETVNLIKHPMNYSGKPKTGGLLSPHVVQLTKEIDQANIDLARILKQLGYRSIALPSRGLPMRPLMLKAALSYCHIAEAAGMGTVGTHSFLITPEFGTRVRLGCLLTEAPIETTTRHDPVDDCTHCLDCVKICPVEAISAPIPGKRYEVDGARCKFYRDRIDNCGLCLKACSYATGHSEVGGPLAAAGSLDRAEAVKPRWDR